MSLNSLKIATSGYLKRQTKAVLIIAVAGYLNFQGIPPIPPPPSGGSSGGWQLPRDDYYDDSKKKRIEKDDEEIFKFIKKFIDSNG